MATPAKPPPLLGGTAIKPVERHGLEAVRYFFHNPETGEIMTRTPLSWLLITVFYVIYYSCLAAFWAICMCIFITTLSYDEPKWQNTNGIIGESPGLGLRPGQPKDLIDSAIIMFNKDSKEGQEEKSIPNWQGWAERVTEFLKVYKNATEQNRGKDCDAEGAKATKDQACLFKYQEKLGSCGKDNYGYDKGTPCIFLKLNRIYGLENKPYNESDLPEDMPEALKSHIQAQSDKDQVWVNCQPKYPADKEMLEKIEYFPPSRGFSNKYFPYMKQDDYLNPLVAVQFVPNLKQGIGQLIHIECRAWAQNIGYNRRDKIGIASLELQIMDDAAVKGQE